MRTLLLLLLPLLLLTPLLAADADGDGLSDQIETDLGQNPGFEAKAANGTPEGWNADATVYSQVTEPVRTGAGALQFVNADKDRYVMCSQQLPLVPGKAYEFSVWAKSENIEGNDSGATICMEWYGADEKYLGGSYPAGVTGTTDWTRISALSGRIPETAARCSVTCYVRKGMTGKAWWDDVEVKQWLEPPLQTMLLKPNYRGIVTPQLKQIELAAELMLTDYGVKPSQVELSCQLVDLQSGKPVREVKVTPRAALATVTMPTEGLAVGKYELQTTLSRKADGAPRAGETPAPPGIMGSDKWRIEVPADDLTKRTAYIDEHNRLILNGEPFLPLGMYWSGLNEADLEVYKDSAFNCVMPYGMPTQEQMDLAQRSGLKVIYSVKDIYVGTAYAPKDLKTPEDERAFIESKTKQFKDHPALLAWYLNDELSIDQMPSLEAHQQWLEELDPNHPTWIVLYQVGQLHLYRKTFDVLGTDPYPIPSRPAREAARYTVLSQQSTRGSRPVWQVPQAMNWASYQKTEEEKKAMRMPTLEEMRSMTWQCLTEGASGLIYYSWFDLKKNPAEFEWAWPNMKQVAAEVKQWTPALLSIEEPAVVTAEKQAWLHWTTRKLGNVTYLFAVNDEGEAHQATFRLGQMPKEVKLEGRTVPEKRGQTVEAEFAPFELRVYRISD